MRGQIAQRKPGSCSVSTYVSLSLRTCLCPSTDASLFPSLSLGFCSYLCLWYLRLRLTWGEQAANCCCSWLRKGRSLAQDQLLGPLHSLMLLLLSRRTQPEQPQRQFS